jgi:hypothetical protein
MLLKEKYATIYSGLDPQYARMQISIALQQFR